MPADPGPRRVFGHEDLLEAVRRKAGKGFGTGAERRQEFGHVFGSCEAAAIEIIAPPERNGATLSREAAEFELPEGEFFDIS